MKTRNAPTIEYRRRWDAPEVYSNLFLTVPVLAYCYVGKPVAAVLTTAACIAFLMFWRRDQSAIGANIIGRVSISLCTAFSVACVLPGLNLTRALGLLFIALGTARMLRKSQLSQAHEVVYRPLIMTTVSCMHTYLAAISV